MKWLEGIALTALAILAPIKAIIITVAFLITMDLITGVWAAIKRKEKFSSARFRNSVSKLIIYQTAVITGFLVETFMINDFPISKMVAGLIGMVELTSIYENLNSISGNNLLRDIIKRLGSKNDLSRDQAEIEERNEEESP